MAGVGLLDPGPDPVSDALQHDYAAPAQRSGLAHSLRKAGVRKLGESAR